MFLLIFVALVTALIATAHLYVKNSFSYWKRKKVPFIEPTFPFGNFKNTFLQRISFADRIKEIYNSTTEPFVGVYSTVYPALMIRDPKIIQDILIRDFASFHDRSFYIDGKVDPMAENLLLQRGEKWKYFRSKLTPAFSSGKIKAMVPHIVNCGISLEKYFEKFAESGETLDAREIFACFSTNLIATIGFGIEIDCIKDPDSEFRRYGKKIFQPSIRRALRAVAFLNPFLARIFRVRFTDKDVADFMIDTVRNNLEYREKNNIVRKDFFQLLIQLRNTGMVPDDGDDWSVNASNNNKSLTVEEMAAQSFLFFGGGFESSSTTMAFCMYELARNPEVQQRAYEEIDMILNKYDGALSYDSIMEMKYVKCCIEETLRMYPVFPVLSRLCTKSYKFPDSDYVIDKNMPVLIPTIGIQCDPKYFDQPKEFIPGRFDEKTTNRKSFTEMPFLSFGMGPRSCIGLRLAELQTKIAIILLLKKFKFDLGEEHRGKEMKLNPKSQFTAPINGIQLNVSFR